MPTYDKPDLDKELADLTESTNKLVAIAAQHGFVLDPNEWLTINHYAEVYGVSPEEVNNWIARKIVPADCTIVVPELDDIRLLKDQIYKL